MTSSASKGTTWPREFRMVSSTASAGPKFWTHELYRGPNQQPVRIMYSRTKLQSEEIAHEFLEETVLGFDMEWPWQTKGQSHVPLQQRVGLIQIASEDKIALFHIGLHAGHTGTDILAPALRKIIESENITKTGVGILNADFSRLRRWFGLKPRGAFELSHFHNLVTYGAKHPIKVKTRMKALSKLVEEHLGLPLFKGKVRTSNWSRPLCQAQIQYAAADAYAGVMLYHCMNAKRLAMDPAPPLPLHAEIYLSMRQGMGSIIPVQLGSSSKDTSGISAVEFYQQLMTGEARSQCKEVVSHIGKKQDEDGEGEDGEEQEEVLENIDAFPPSDQAVSPARKGDLSAFEKRAVPHIEEEKGLVVVGRRGRQIILEQRNLGALSKLPERRHPEAPQQTHARETASEPKQDYESGQRSRPTTIDSEATKDLLARLSAHRKSVAKERQCPAYVVAHNSLLSAISERRPRNEQELRRIQGVGKVKAELYGPAWLTIVHQFLEEQTTVTVSAVKETATSAPLPTTPSSRRTQTKGEVNGVSSDHEMTPAVLHTGLSFKMENANLEAEPDQTVIEISDGSSAFGSPMRSPSPASLKRKRELLDPSTESQTRQCPVLPRPVIHPRLPTVDATPQPDSEANFSLTQSTAEANTTDLRPAEILRTSAARSQHAAPKQIFSSHAAPQGAASMPKDHASTEAQIFRNKLLAFNRRVGSAIILSETTIAHIIRKPPRTAQELVQVPNIMPFANACARKNQCLLTFILKSTRKPPSSVS